MQAGQTVLSLRPGGGGGGGGNRVSRVLASSLSSDLPLLRPHGAAPPPSRSLKVGTFPLSLSLTHSVDLGFLFFFHCLWCSIVFRFTRFLITEFALIWLWYDLTCTERRVPFGG